MRNRNVLFCIVVSALAVPIVLCGCEKKVSSSSKETVKSDGSTKSEKSTVTEAPDGTVTTKEKTEKTTPPKKP